MERIDQRAALEALAERTGESLAALSRLIGRNDAYLQQFIRRGTPRVLAERDRRLLAAYFGVPDRDLGGEEPAPVPLVLVPRIDVVASAGPGALIEDDRRAGGEAIDPALLRRLGVRPSDITLITASGESMAPTIADGDDMLVDRSDRQVDERGGVFVLRADGVLMVKRLRRDGSGIALSSDNPGHPAIIADAIDVIGRVVWLSRRLR